MRAGELCVRDVVTAWEDESVVEAARRMARFGVGDLIVVKQRLYGPHPTGIVTDRDLVVQVLARPDRVPLSTTIGEIMQRDLVTGSEDDDVEAIAEKMRAHAIRRVPIVDRLGGLQGVLSIDDVIGWMRDQIETATKLLERQGRGLDLRSRATR
ncbi:MAG: CBS domain-containing protein [Kofleriaceae bacterium]